MAHEIVGELVACLDQDLREAWEERAAILEFEAGLQREMAEAIALLMLLKQYPARVARSVDPAARKKKPRP